jgi:hypothetical protein
MEGDPEMICEWNGRSAQFVEHVQTAHRMFAYLFDQQLRSDVMHGELVRLIYKGLPTYEMIEGEGECETMTPNERPLFGYATGINHIGKEANRWEEQHHLGLDEDEQIHYGMGPTDVAGFQEALLSVVNIFGQRRVAEKMRISRKTLSKLLHGSETRRLKTRLGGFLRAVKELDDHNDHERGICREATARRKGLKRLT